MILYHGTSAARLIEILKTGLRPSVNSGMSNYRCTMASFPRYVYLTETSPIFYAAKCPRINDESELAIIECHISDETMLYPDEDCMLKAFWANSVTEVERRALKEEWRTNGYSEQEKAHWRTLLATYGNVCYEGIVAPARYILLPAGDSCLTTALGCNVYVGVTIDAGAEQSRILKKLFQEGLHAALTGSKIPLSYDCCDLLTKYADIRSQEAL